MTEHRGIDKLGRFHRPGTTGALLYAGCRCAECVTAQTARVQQRQARRAQIEQERRK